MAMINSPLALVLEFLQHTVNISQSTKEKLWMQKILLGR